MESGILKFVCNCMSYYSCASWCGYGDLQTSNDQTGPQGNKAVEIHYESGLVASHTIFTIKKYLTLICRLCETQVSMQSVNILSNVMRPSNLTTLINTGNIGGLEGEVMSPMVYAYGQF